MLGALGAGYFLTAAFLALLIGLESTDGATGAPAIVAAIKLMAGALVVGVLAISLQVPLDRHLSETAHRLRALGPENSTPTRRVMPTISLAIAVVISYGIHVVHLPQDILPDALLQSALILSAGGVLTLVFAVSSLHLACGVLMALVGFEMVYARLDPGLLVTGGLAAVQLMFAIVASHFVGSAGSTALTIEED
jgi:hypothetical protein